jgi:hypothetical protein
MWYHVLYYFWYSFLHTLLSGPTNVCAFVTTYCLYESKSFSLSLPVLFSTSSKMLISFGYKTIIIFALIARKTPEIHLGLVWIQINSF